MTDVEQSDSGLYTCTASTESGETSWTAAVVVDPHWEPHNTTEERPVVPGAPDRPVVVNTAQTSLTVKWRQLNSSEIVTGFTVEYFSPELQTGWVLVAKAWNFTTIEVNS